MLTRPGFDARTDTLRWADLEQVYDSGPLPASTTNRFAMALPARAEPAILYTIWQRSDSPEAFYACSDVTIVGGSGATPPTTVAPPPPTAPVPPTTAPSTTAPPAPPTTPGAPLPPTTGPTPPTTVPPPTTPDAPAPPPTVEPPDGDEPFSPVAGLRTTATTTASWDGGRCVEVRVDNVSGAALGWEVHYRPGGDVTTLWNATGEEVDHDGHDGHTAFVGEDWNERLAAGAWTTFGMCVDL
jgi:cellulase/cellobiase CelA1